MKDQKKSMAGKLGYLASEATHQRQKAERIAAYEADPKLCPMCEKPLVFEKKHNKFCGSSCAAIFNNKGRIRTEDSKARMSSIMKNKIEKGVLVAFKINYGKDHPSYKDGTYTRQEKICPICENVFVTNHNTTFCSIDCSTHGKKTCYGEYYYCLAMKKDVWLQSSWEVKTARYLDDKNISWIRPNAIAYYLDNKNKKYYPDFYLTAYDIYLDPKNPFCQKQDKEKLKAVNNQTDIILKVGEIDEILLYIDTL